MHGAGRRAQNVRSIFERRANFFLGQFREIGDNRLERIASRNISQDVGDTNARSRDARRAEAYCVI